MTVVIVVFGFYYAALLLLLIGWHKVKERAVPEHHRHLKISVIVPFRNEEKNIDAIVRDLIMQSYNHEHFEVILCNDHSTDSSAQKASSAIAGLPNFSLIESNGKGKKAALTFGTSVAGGDVIVTTDADCAVPENWLARINHAFQDPSVKMVFGGVAMQRAGSFFSGLQAMEFVSLVGTAAATAGLGFPILCNGANLAFLKSVFYEVNGYEGNQNIPSGDDEFLLQKILRIYPHGVSFLSTRDSVVSTQPQGSLKEFIGQRVRWAGKWRYNKSPVAKVTALFVLAFQIAFIVMLVAVFTDAAIARTAAVLIAAKMLLEFMFLFQFNTFLGVRWRMGDFLVLQLAYPLYAIGIGVASNFLDYEWKGRKWNHVSVKP